MYKFKMKKAEEGLKTFIKAFEYWRERLCPEFDVTYKLADIAEYAAVEYQLGTGTAEVVLSEKHAESIDYELRKTAFEEASHLAFSEIRELLEGMYSRDFIDLVEHRVINKYKSILIKG
ncbi:hypothetical protein DRO38_05740 [Candidatus Bathyarchaeota archaeon]|nr:MAG: hypothetical protein DRO38_05740 [Candidatus Bathyarchaeota archaeon]